MVCLDLCLLILFKYLAVFYGIDVPQSNLLTLRMFPIFAIASNVAIGENPCAVSWTTYEAISLGEKSRSRLGLCRCGQNC